MWTRGHREQNDEPMSSYLRHAVDRARERLHYSKNQRAAYEAYADDSDRSQRTLRKLRKEEKRRLIARGPSIGWVML